MHLDNINVVDPRDHGLKKPNTWSKDKKKETRSCYNCGKPSHLSKVCRSKNKVTVQMNVISHTSPESEDDEVWEVVTDNLAQLDVAEDLRPEPLQPKGTRCAKRRLSAKPLLSGIASEIAAET
jgi:hypothetical protein